MAARSATAVMLLAFAPAEADSAPLDGYVRRLEYATILGDLHARLLATSSATRTLEGWCRAHGLADSPKIVADRIAGPDKPISAEQRARLDIRADEPVRYRHVRLRCGDRILSEADNWYVPSRLTAEMNAQLDGGDTPFGAVVAPLGIARRTLSAEQLWKPLADGWEMFRDAEAADRSLPSVPAELIRHRAVVVDRTGRPIAEVAETYGSPLLDFMDAR